MNDPKEEVVTEESLEEYKDEITTDPWPEIDDKIDNGEEIP